MSSSGAAARDGRLKVGLRILEVNHQSLLGMTHTEAVQILRSVGDKLLVLVCDGFDPKAAAAIEVRAWGGKGGVRPAPGGALWRTGSFIKTLSSCMYGVTLTTATK